MSDREIYLFNLYRLERRAGSDPLTATERMGDYAKRLDALDAEYLADLEIIRQCIGRVEHDHKSH